MDHTPSEPTLIHSILAYIQRRGSHEAVHTLTRKMARDLRVPRRSVHHALQTLLAEGTIAYTYRFGTSFIESSYQHPVKLSDCIWIAQPGQTLRTGKDGTVIYIAAGDAFGDGRHATTRMALSGVEQALDKGLGKAWPKPAACLDVGTGSGILALAALKLGMEHAWGVDHDACARSEAKVNAGLNGMANRLHILAHPSKISDLKFQLITANLRLPTLCQLAPFWSKHRAPETWLVISGIRESETEGLIRNYHPHGWRPNSTATEDGWAMILFRQ